MVSAKALSTTKWLIVAIWITFMIIIHYLADNQLLDDVMPWKKSLHINDVFGHFILVGTLGFFAALVAKSHFEIGRVKVLKLVVVFMILATIEETTQLVRPNRGFSFADMGANIAGLFVFSKIGEWLKFRMLKTA